MTDEAVRDYLVWIGQFALLTAEQEVELGERVQRGLVAEIELETAEASQHDSLRQVIESGRRAEGEFVCANLRLVVSLAKRMPLAVGVDLMDRIQDGNDGMHHAVRKFDTSKGFKFSTYATWWIRQAMTRRSADGDRLVRYPVHVVEQLDRVRAEQRRLEQALGRVPTVDEIASGTGQSRDRVALNLRYIADAAVSLDALIGEGDDASLHDFIAVDDPTEEWSRNEAISTVVRDALDSLSYRERAVMMMRHGFPEEGGEEMTLDEIGARFGVTRERIRHGA